MLDSHQNPLYRHVGDVLLGKLPKWQVNWIKWLNNTRNYGGGTTNNLECLVTIMRAAVQVGGLQCWEGCHLRQRAGSAEAREKSSGHFKTSIRRRRLHHMCEAPAPLSCRAYPRCPACRSTGELPPTRAEDALWATGAAVTPGQVQGAGQPLRCG